MSNHDGHRQRLRERFLAEDLDNFNDHQVLEIMLFHSIPRKDTNEIAHDLLKRFRTLKGVLEAPVEELKKVPGVGENTAVFLSILNSFCRYYRVAELPKDEPLNTVGKCAEQLLPHFSGKRHEMVCLLCLDAKCKPICCYKVGEGSVNSAAVPIRKIVEMALNADASSVVLAHNHPSGIAIPSGEDVQTTKRLAMALQAVDIVLADHFVVADGDWVSMVQSNMYHPNAEYVLI